MGRVRQRYIKNLAREMVEQNPGLFSEDFQHNKNVLKERPEFAKSKTLRNKVAGYIVRVLENKKF